MHSVTRRAGEIATALPALLLARAAALAGRDELEATLRRWADRAPRVAAPATAPLWLLVIFRGVLYPLVGADDLEQSWGGPTLLGAWMTHLAIAVAALGLVSFVVAVATRRSRRPLPEESAVQPR